MRSEQLYLTPSEDPEATHQYRKNIHSSNVLPSPLPPPLPPLLPEKGDFFF